MPRLAAFALTFAVGAYVGVWVSNYRYLMYMRAQEENIIQAMGQVTADEAEAWLNSRSDLG